MNLHRLVKWADQLLKHSPKGSAAKGSILLKLRASLDELPGCRAFIRRFLRDATPLLECQKVLKTNELNQNSYKECQQVIKNIPALSPVRRGFETWAEETTALQNNELICVENLDFQYPSGDFHLNVPKFRVLESEKIGVIGPSGSGKTTLLNLLAGILIPEKGDISFAGQMVSSLSDAGRRDYRITQIGFVFQDFQLIDYLHVLDNILHPYRITKTLKLTPQIRTRARAFARDMGIEDKLFRLPQDLSQGEKQRAAICRALLPQPRLILADEATGNLDPANKVMILELLFKQIQQSGSTLIAVTHDVELLKFFDRVIDFKTFVEGGKA